MKDEDKTFENERKHMNEPVEDRGPLDLTLLTDQYREDLHKYKEREGLYLKTENQLQGTKQIVIEMSATIRELSNHNKSLSEEIDRLNKYVEVIQKEKYREYKTYNNFYLVLHQLTKTVVDKVMLYLTLLLWLKLTVI